MPGQYQLPMCCPGNDCHASAVKHFATAQKQSAQWTGQRQGLASVLKGCPGGRPDGKYPHLSVERLLGAGEGGNRQRERERAKRQAEPRRNLMLSPDESYTLSEAGEHSIHILIST